MRIYDYCFFCGAPRDTCGCVPFFDESSQLPNQSEMNQPQIQVVCDDHSYLGVKPCPACKDDERAINELIDRTEKCVRENFEVWAKKNTAIEDFELKPYEHAYINGGTQVAFEHWRKNLRDKAEASTVRKPPKPKRYDDFDDENDAFDGRISPLTPKAKTETVDPGLDEIPYEGLAAVGHIFKEGEKYGRDNWKKGVGDIDYQRERCRHAIRHLILWANGDRSESHLAKVAWFCLTQIWIEVNERLSTKR